MILEEHNKSQSKLYPHIVRTKVYTETSDKLEVQCSITVITLLDRAYCMTDCAQVKQINTETPHSPTEISSSMQLHVHQ